MSEDLYNQPDLIGDIDLWANDPVLRTHAVAAGADEGHLAPLGQSWGRAKMRALGRAAERHPPEPDLFDRGGRRRDAVAFHPAYHALMSEGIGAGYAALPWNGGRHATHAAMVYLMSQVEPGVCCPLTMTYAAVSALKVAPLLDAIWKPKLLSRSYDPAICPVTQKSGATMGMAMTERQGGSDVRANATRAVPAADGWLLTGHKWFCSAPMSDAFLTLAQTAEGLTCFLVPRWLDTGPNAIRIDRLKDKLGNRANASAEIRYGGALAHRVGEEGAGIRTIIEMVHHTRLDTAIAPAGLMRAALYEAHHWVTHRAAFQRRLIDQPLMRRVLADMVLDWEGALALAFHVSRAFDDPARMPFARIGVALAKFLNNKLCPPLVAEAMEVLGGMGFVEDTPLPMLYREAPLNGIWEGSGNVICLDILRTLQKAPEAGAALQDEFDAVRGSNAEYDAALKAFRASWASAPAEADARRFASEAARLLTASVLLRQAPDAVAEGYCSTRLSGGAAIPYGTARGLDEARVLKRLGNVG
ncbi:acyl-CoA dehydrogenase family protein [Ovoidimarina sediminis]|uniref:acyl-CoA dehydrogenase family protein n=1 Tax=Ovoidimarina sediminis TaxID=3079856 RepID=UPI00291019CD|nr:acyl-CoA dehydrogenase family protein [Rhodophyticola sp. MJ-SS7]MDU8945691.1 acyl-CoA dehydrogenase family protein [Rhodophyticola sp. MJ-SS7]